MFKHLENKDELFITGNIGIDDWYSDNGFSTADISEFAEYARFEKDLDVTINSLGGSVDQALLLKEIIEKYQGNVNIKIIGTAASAATIITCAKNAKVTMAQGSLFMIHKPWSQAVGNSDTMKGMAAFLEKRENTLLDIYVEKTKQSKDLLKQYLDKTTYFTPQEALDLHFIDGIDEQKVDISITDNTLNINDMNLDLNNSKFKDVASFFNLNFNKGNNMNQINRKQLSAENKENNNFIAINSAQDLLQNYPTFAKQILEQGIEQGKKQERERIKALDELSNAATPDALNKAKYETLDEPQAFAYNMMKTQQAKIATARENLEQDAQALAKVTDGIQGDTVSKEQAFDLEIQNIADAINNLN